MVISRKISGLRQLVRKALISDTGCFFQSALRGQATILCYHRITRDRYSAAAFQPDIYLSVRDDLFEQHIQWLAQHQHVQPVSRIVKEFRHSRRHMTGITFDDGYRDNLEVALPVLEKYKIPATIFVSTGFINRTASLWWQEIGFILANCQRVDFEWNSEIYKFTLSNDQERHSAYLKLVKLFKKSALSEQEKLLAILRPQSPVKFDYDSLLLSWDELKKLSRHPLITIGGHTVNHPILSCETENEALHEMATGRNHLSSELGQPVDLFAYTVGGPEEAGKREFELASRAGFIASFTTRTGHIFRRHIDYMHCLPRITLDYFDTLDDFKWKTGGGAALLKNQGKWFITD